MTGARRLHREAAKRRVPARALSSVPQILHRLALFSSNRGWSCGAGQYVADLAKIHRPPLRGRYWTEHGALMQPTVKPKQADDPHDVLEVAPGIALVAPSNAADPTDEEVSNLLRTAARRRSGVKTGNKPAVAASSSAPPVDTTFRPAAGNNARF